MKTSIQFIFRFIFLEKRLFFSGLAMTFLISTLTWVGPKIIAYLIDEGLTPRNQKIALIGVSLLALSELLRLLTVYFSQMIYAILGQNVIEKVRGKMVSHLLKLPVHYFDRVSSGGMMTRVVGDVNALTDFFQSGFVSVLGNFASLVAIFVGLFTINFKLGSILFISFVPVALLCARFSEKLRKVYEETRYRLSELNSMLADFLFGMKTIRALGVSDQKHRELSAQVRKYAGSQLKMIGTFALFHPTVSLGIGVLLILLISIGLPLVADGTLKVGEWVAALSYILLLQHPLVDISDRWNFFLAGITSIDRVKEVFNEVPEESGVKIAPQFEKIEFRNFHFTYIGAKHESLNHVNLIIHRGDWIGVYGESGSGKSTFLQVLYGFYPASEGLLLWDDSSYLDYDLSSIRRHFGVVEQFPFLFSGTIEENITLFGEHPFLKEELAQTFKGFPLIESLLNDSQFHISERGGNLSMGQKQMITFLRAYLSKPSVWILDEATAYFDAEAEAEVLEALENLRQEKITVIQVAHRPEALTKMSRLLKVKRGTITHVIKDSKPVPTNSK